MCSSKGRGTRLLSLYTDEWNRLSTLSDPPQTRWSSIPVSSVFARANGVASGPWTLRARLRSGGAALLHLLQLCAAAREKRLSPAPLPTQIFSFPREAASHCFVLLPHFVPQGETAMERIRWFSQSSPVATGRACRTHEAFTAVETPRLAVDLHLHWGHRLNMSPGTSSGNRDFLSDTEPEHNALGVRYGRKSHLGDSPW